VPGRSLWRNRNFTVFLTAQTLSALGDSFSRVAIPLLVLHSTGSVVQMGLVTGLTGVASLITCPFAGMVADRVNRRALLMSCDIARCVLFALIPLAWLGSPQVWLVYVVVPLGGVFAMLFQVTYVTVVPAIVESDQITEANGRLYGSYAMAEVGGPLAAGVVSSLFGPSVAIAVDAASFALSALGILAVRLHAARPDGSTVQPDPAEPDVVRPEPAGSRHRAVLRDFLAGARFLWRHPVLRPLTILLSLLTFLTYGIDDVIIYHLKHDLAQPDRAVGYVLAAGTVGTLVASLAVPRLRKRLGFGVSWIGAFALAGVAVAFLGPAGDVPVTAGLTTVLLFGTGVAGICSMSLRQEVTPSDLLGRVTSAFWTIHYALGPPGAAVLTLATAAYGITPVCLAAGVAMLLIALSGTFTAIVRSGPERPPGETAEAV
jgi:MFS family permease